MSEDLCRICAKVIKGIDAIKLFESTNRKLLLQIKDLTGVRLKNSLGLPKLMCPVCYKDLNESYKFREDFLKVQATFKVQISKDNKKQKTIGGVKATEFVQVFIVKKEKHIVSDHEDNYGADEEKEINIAGSQQSEKKPEMCMEKESCGEINALELKPNEENTLEDTKISIEDKIEDSVFNNKLQGNFESSKILSDDENNEVADYHSDKDSEEEYKPAANVNPSRKSRAGRKRKNKTDCKIKSVKQTDTKESAESKSEITKSRKKRKDAEIHPNVFICDQCGNHFTCRHHFKLHLRRHSGDKRCACELCPDKFFTTSELSRHMRRHTGERPFACKFCDRRFTDYSTRIKHERTHTNERPFMCSQCGKSFYTSYILKNHMLTHTGERHFKCDVCNKAFTRRTHLVVHFRSIMHKQAVEKDKRPILQEELPQTHCLIQQPTHIPTFLV